MSSDHEPDRNRENKTEPASIGTMEESDRDGHIKLRSLRASSHSDVDVDVDARNLEIGLSSSEGNGEPNRIPFSFVGSPTPRVQRHLLPRMGVRAYTFHLFPFLPKELRDMVWDMLLPPPRIIPLLFNSIAGRVRYDQLQQTAVYIGEWQFRNPYVLHLIEDMSLYWTCQESPASTARHGYEIVHLSNNTRERAWFSHKRDTLYLVCNAVSGINPDRTSLPPWKIPLSKNFTKKIVNLAVIEGFFDTSWPFLDDVESVPFPPNKISSLTSSSQC